MNGKAAKKIRKIANKSSDPARAYKILKEMYVKGSISLLGMSRLKELN